MKIHYFAHDGVTHSSAEEAIKHSASDSDMVLYIGAGILAATLLFYVYIAGFRNRRKDTQNTQKDD